MRLIEHFFQMFGWLSLHRSSTLYFTRLLHKRLCNPRHLQQAHPPDQRQSCSHGHWVISYNHHISKCHLVKNVGKAKSTLWESSPACHSGHTASSCLLRWDCPIFKSHLFNPAALAERCFCQIAKLPNCQIANAKKPDLHRSRQGNGLDELGPFKRLLKRL